VTSLLMFIMLAALLIEQSVYIGSQFHSSNFCKLYTNNTTFPLLLRF